MTTILAILISLQVLSGHAFGSEKPDAQGVRYLHERLSSACWQVRYCLTNELNGRNDAKQVVIMALMRDANEKVSIYAHRIYMHNYLFVDKKRIIDNLDKLNPMLGGSHAADQQKYYESIRSVANYAALLRKAKIDEAGVAGTLGFFGILAKPDEAQAIERFMESQNEYVLLETAKAFFRIGDQEKGLKTIERILAGNCKEHLFYQTEALYVLRAADLTRFKQEYRSLRKRVQGDPDREKIQPNWMNEHYLRGLEMEQRH